MVKVVFVLPSLWVMASALIEVRNLEDLLDGSAATTLQPPASKNEDFTRKLVGSREEPRGIRSRGKAFRAFALTDYSDCEVLSTFKPTPPPP